MPRDGNGVYSKPAGIDASPDTTIESADWNSFTADVEQDLNTARPIAAGGTGKTTAVGAADALSTQGANIASASTTNLALATGVAVTITGTTTITAFGTVAAGARRVLTFADALILTHNAASLILPGGANITTAAGDTAELLSLGSGNWRVVRFSRANGKAVVAEVTLSGAETLTNKTLTSPTVTTPTLTLKQSTSPAPTVEGDIQWDTNDDRIVVGDGAGQKTFSDDSKLLPLSGGTMTGKITLDADPTNNLHAATKQYVDTGLATKPGLYTGSTRDETVFPVGHTVVVSGGSTAARNATLTIYPTLSGSNDLYGQSGTTALSGTWRAHGVISGPNILAQRTA